MRFTNKKAKFNYELESEKIEAGIVLSGDEVKAIRNGLVDLTNAHVKIIKNEAFLINVNIAKALTPTRTRKLLLNRKEIVQIETKVKQKRLTIIPIMLYNRGNLFKLKIALGRTKRKYEKRENLKKKAINREIEKRLKE